MDQQDKPKNHLPRVWGGENVSPPMLMGLYSQAGRGEITAHLVGLEGLARIFTVFTKKEIGDEGSYNPTSSAKALEAVATRRRVDIETLRYLGGLVGEEITHAKERARKTLIGALKFLSG
jgi:hypothetical protein